MKKMFSIIIPCYNNCEYIEAAVKSCFNQGLDSSCYEIIVVDDGSTDGSGEIINKFKIHPFVHIISQKNQGVSIARKNGLNIASSKYVIFLDADDCLQKNTLADIKSEIFKHKDVMWFAFPIKRVSEDGSEIKNIDSSALSSYKYDNNICLSPREAFEMYKRKLLPPVICASVFDRDLIKSVEFPTGRFEDSRIFYSLLRMGHSVRLLKRGAYLYYHRQRSFMNHEWDAEKWIMYAHARLDCICAEHEILGESKSLIESTTRFYYSLKYLCYLHSDDCRYSVPASIIENGGVKYSASFLREIYARCRACIVKCLKKVN